MSIHQVHVEQYLKSVISHVFLKKELLSHRRYVRANSSFNSKYFLAVSFFFFFLIFSAENVYFFTLYVKYLFIYFSTFPASVVFLHEFYRSCVSSLHETLHTAYMQFVTPIHFANCYFVHTRLYEFTC